MAEHSLMNLLDRVLPVIDLKGGVVVRGVAGRRDEYRPVESIWCSNASPHSVGSMFLRRFGFPRAYVADLDSIAGQTPHVEAVRQLQSVGLHVLLDAGVRDEGHLLTLQTQLAEAGVRTDLLDWVLGLESIRTLASVRDILSQVGQERCLFSVDLQHGRPLTSNPAWRDAAPVEIANQVCNEGVRRLIVLDLGAVGVGCGPRVLSLCRRITNAAVEDVELISGGGVRDWGDVKTFCEHGCRQVLVASALHNGAIRPPHDHESQEGYPN